MNYPKITTYEQFLAYAAPMGPWEMDEHGRIRKRCRCPLAVAGKTRVCDWCTGAERLSIPAELRCRIMVAADHRKLNPINFDDHAADRAAMEKAFGLEDK